MAELKLFDRSGMDVFSISGTINEINEAVNYRLGGLSVGIYKVQLFDGESWTSKTFIKE